MILLIANLFIMGTSLKGENLLPQEQFLLVWKMTFTTLGMCLICVVEAAPMEVIDASIKPRHTSQVHTMTWYTKHTLHTHNFCDSLNFSSSLIWSYHVFKITFII